jgi:hypothetical protein
VQTIHPDWMSVPRTVPIRAVALAADGTVTTAPQPADPIAPKGAIRVMGTAIVNGEKVLTEAFPAVDSFDLSESRGEVVFSAKRDKGFDIGLVAIEGSPISWIPADPADEVGVQWAPRGNKISFVIRSAFGDVIRTVHIPTSADLTVDFPFSRVHALAWDPAGERFAIAHSSPVASDSVEVMKYGGGGRTVAVKSEARVDANIEPFAGHAIVLQRPDIAYEERLPLVIWVTDDPLAWSDARADLIRNARVALVVTSREPDAALWKRAKETAWIDAGRAFVVTARATPIEGATVIAGQPGVPEGRYRTRRSVVEVPAADVESFAARFIAEQLKRTALPNGSSSR